MQAGKAQPRTLTLFPEDRCEGLLPDSSIVRLKLSAVRLRRPRQSGACWLTLELWRELGLDRVWTELLDRSREGTRWNQVLFALVAYRPLAPGSESRLHGEWFERIAATTGFNVSFDVLLYDLTRTYFESAPRCRKATSVATVIREITGATACR
jgi:hypothetical protein